MDENLERYIFKYYNHLFTKSERETWNRIIKQGKYFHAINVELPSLNKVPDEKFEKKYFGLDIYDTFLSEKEIEEFWKKTVERVLEENKDKIFLNYCPICGLLARTPKASQCPNGHRF
jgi:rubrerythrin